MNTERIVFAHRGLNSQAPENTMAAFRKAVECGARWIETDVDIIADGTPIICHDTQLDRTTNRGGTYYEISSQDLNTIDAGTWYDPQYAGERLPKLAQLVDYMNETGLNANIEIKSNEQGRERTLKLIDTVIEHLERVKKSKIIISCFNHVLLYELHKRAPKLPIGALYETCALYDDWRSTCEMVGASYIHPENEGLTKARVQAFRDAGLGVNVWTVNSRARANELFNWGVTGVFTDYADKLLDLEQN
ncbi:glycerophosphoryl diester phosphodiesterase [Gleimia hominis]|uniref:Glycerophosphoryl diester phosphodiesterase n=1 Tax=Gleimia hominis TaxID=595468 RepID=A0ABU3I9A9_9ACTO|nr:glycerophosphoryl diester phosphodiesterase [Gleimia hominis]MDT3766960.1 glycerophosphoryl diester phosphodiesterase [Gleimia hominis]